MEIREIITNIVIELQQMSEEEIVQTGNQWLEEGIFKHPITIEVINSILR